ncbi:hypothetical protein SLEP1_g48106 [Rubroshorea leprosula]|uniref:Uncharacterized protein n=1 Tax=Rubroshorea leprosula TaxID=152421 RepID=A0AAV5LSL1_9ROSI|nr:hypothetical protein SLEP1_g48106 [Rubroshorea leprosula]
MEEDETTLTCIPLEKKKAPVPPNRLPLPKKKRSAFHALKSALYSLLKKPSKSKSISMDIDDVDSKGSWRTFLGSMRLMHLPNNVVHSPPPALHDKHHRRILSSPEQAFVSEELFTPSFSPMQDTASSSSYSTFGRMSWYTSEPNLQDLVECSGEERDRCYDDEGDEMIDAKAEEFINQFYQQIRRQNLDDINRCIADEE